MLQNNIVAHIGETSFAILHTNIRRGGRMVKTAKGAASIAPLVIAGGIVLGVGIPQAAWASCVDQSDGLVATGSSPCVALQGSYTGSTGNTANDGTEAIIFGEFNQLSGNVSGPVIIGRDVISVINNNTTRTNGTGDAVTATRGATINLENSNGTLTITSANYGVRSHSRQGHYDTTVNLLGNVTIESNASFRVSPDAQNVIYASARQDTLLASDYNPNSLTAEDLREVRNSVVNVEGLLTFATPDGVEANMAGLVTLKNLDGTVNVPAGGHVLEAKGFNPKRYESLENTNLGPFIGGRIYVDNSDLAKITVNSVGAGVGIRSDGVGAEVEISGDVSIELVPASATANRAIRALADGQVIVGGDATITARGREGTGIYAHDGGEVRIAGDANIETFGEYGHAVLVGKPQVVADYKAWSSGESTDMDGGPGTIEIDGMLNVVTNDKTANAIHVQGIGSSLTAGSVTDTSVIQSSGNVIVFGGGPGKESRDTAGDVVLIEHLDTEGSVVLINATIESTSSGSDLVYVSGRDNQSSLTVTDSDLVAQSNGSIVNVSNDLVTDDGSVLMQPQVNGRENFLFTADGGTFLKGSMTMSDENQFDVRMDDTALWDLEGLDDGSGPDSSQTSQLSNITMGENAVIYAAETGGAGYHLKLRNRDGSFGSLRGGILRLQDGEPNDVLTIDGDLGDGSFVTRLELDVVLGDDASPSDVLVVTGRTFGTGSQSTAVVVNNIGGTGAQTVTGILVVEVQGGSDGQFSLANGNYTLPGTNESGTSESALIAGAYAYALRKEGENWYLQSQLIDQTPIWQPAAPIYEVLPAALSGLNRIGTLAQRIEGRQMLVGSVDPEHSNGAWIRIEGERLDVTPQVSTTGASYDQSFWRLQAGLDTVVAETDNGFWVAGVNLFTGSGSTDVMSRAGNGSISTDAQGVGLTATYYGNSGFYTDVQLQYTAFESDLFSNILGVLASGVDGEGRLASLELGQEFSLPNEMTLTPQAQLMWSDVTFDRFTGPNAEAVSLGSRDSLQLRLGLAAEKNWDFGNGENTRLYGIANVIHEMRGETSVLVDGTELAMSTPEWVGEIGIGGSYDWAGDGGETYSLYGEVSASRELSGGEARGLAGTFGFRVEF